MKKVVMMAVIAMVLLGVNSIFVHQARAAGLLKNETEIKKDATIEGGKSVEVGGVALQTINKGNVTNTTTIDGTVKTKQGGQGDAEVGVVRQGTGGDAGTITNTTTVNSSGSVTAEGKGNANVGVVDLSGKADSVKNVTTVDGPITAKNGDANVGVVSLNKGGGAGSIENTTTVSKDVKATNNARVGVVGSNVLGTK